MGFFRKDQVGTIQRQVTVDFVGRYLVIPLDAVLAGGIHHGLCAQNVGAQEQARVFHRTVHMALCGKIDHDIRVLFFKQFFHSRAVRDVAADKAELRIFHGILKTFQIACIRQCIQADNPVFGVFLKLIIHKIASDKTGSARDKNGHKEPPIS